MAARPTPDESAVMAVGFLLDGRYRIDSVLGSGGMSKVYKAEHTKIGRPVAIKVLRSRLGGSADATQRFQREALASGRLDHPNIVSVSDSGETGDGELFLVMEALEGAPLSERLQRERRLPWREAVGILCSVLAGLQHAHDRGVVHRDIKPDNVFLATKGDEVVVKILDFGIAKLVAGTADDPASTRTGLTIGTPAYLSPEQAVGGEITPASDLYSASILLYELLTGRPPFVLGDALAMMTAHVGGDVPTFEEVAPDLAVPADLERAVRRGLAKVPGDRFGSAREYGEALAELLRAPDPMAGPETGHSEPAGLASGVAGMRPASRAGNPDDHAGAPEDVAPGPRHVSAAGTPPPGAGPSPGDTVPAADLGRAPTLSIESLPVARGRAPRAQQTGRSAGRRRALVAGALVAAALLVGGLVALRGDERAGASPAPRVAFPPGALLDDETRLKAALHDLETARTCAERKAAIPRLTELGGDAAIAALRRARHRMRGGVLGFGETNTNACLKADAERALRQLGSPAR